MELVIIAIEDGKIGEEVGVCNNYQDAVEMAEKAKGRYGDDVHIYMMDDLNTVSWEFRGTT
jgi:hypothetical protein